MIKNKEEEEEPKGNLDGEGEDLDDFDKGEKGDMNELDGEEGKDLDYLDEEEGEDIDDLDDEEEIDDFDKDEEEEEKPFMSALWDVGKDVIIALLIVVILIASIYVYTGNWPPVVVVESDSMQHSDDESFLGVIDTGDLVLVKSIDSRDDVITYMKGKRIGHETYSENGDVLIYRKNGYKEITPVIHRALIWVEVNTTTNNSFDVPELKNHKSGVNGSWEILGSEDRWYNLRGILVLKDIGYDHIDVNLNLGAIFDQYALQGVEPHGGFITLGDHNGPNYDQAMLQDEHGGRVRPIKPEWVIGKARGELPWFGLIKLYFQDETITERAPENSWTMLWITLFLIFAVPISIDIVLILYERKKDKQKKEEEEGDESFEDEEVKDIEEGEEPEGEEEASEDEEEKDHKEEAQKDEEEDLEVELKGEEKD